MLSSLNPATSETFPPGEAAIPDVPIGIETLDRPFPLRISDRWRVAAWLPALLVLAVIVQLLAGAYRVELGNSSDESAHFMNALVLRDYLTHAFGQNPFAFAEAYYLSYPKIAPLMWPPFFHAALGLFLLPGWAPHPAALFFLASLAAWTAFRLSACVSRFSSTASGVVVALLFLVTPIIVDLTTAVMVDIALAALALEASWWLARYYVSGETRHVLLFGLFATCCCLTKGNGVAITLLPGILMLATGRVHLLRTRGLYMSAAMVAALAGPFVYISYRLCDTMGDFTGTGAAHTLSRAYGFTRFLWHELTPVPFALAMLGAVGAVRRARKDPPALRTIVPAALVSLAVAVILFHIILPLEYHSGRYVAPAVAPLLGLVPLGAAFLIELAGYPGRQRQAAFAVLAVAVLGFALMRQPVSVHRPLGYAQFVASLGADGLADRRVLVISDELGEGAMVTEAAIRGASPAPTIVRGSKLLAEGDWMNNNFQTLYGSAADTLALLENLHVDFLVFDASPEAREIAYWSHVEAVIRMAGDRLTPVFSTHVDPIAGPTRPLTVYRVTRRSPGPPAKLRINLRYTYGTVLEK